MKVKTKALHKKLLILFVSSLLALGIAETAMRIFMPEIGWVPEADPVLGWASREYHKFNPDVPKSTGEKRILFLGDSFLAGAGVSKLSNRFPALLGRQLGREYSVITCAAGGWGTDQELLAYLQKGRAWKPNMVVVAFCSNNDIADIVSHHEGSYMLKPYFVLEDNSSLSLFDGFGKPWTMEGLLTTEQPPVYQNMNCFYGSYLLEFFRIRFKLWTPMKLYDLDSFAHVDPRYRMWNIYQQGYQEERLEIFQRQPELTWSPETTVSHASAYIHEDFEINTYQWRLYERLLVELRDQVRADGGELVVMILPVIFHSPDPDTITGGSFEQYFKTPEGGFTFRAAEPRDRVTEICRRNGLTLLDPTPSFRAYLVKHDLHKETWPNLWNRHFSDLGHRIISELTLDFFRESTASGSPLERPIEEPGNHKP